MNANDPPEPQDLGKAWNPTESEPSDRRRMREVLGINAAGIEVVLRLRHQMIALQTRVRQLRILSKSGDVMARSVKQW